MVRGRIVIRVDIDLSAASGPGTKTTHLRTLEISRATNLDKVSTPDGPDYSDLESQYEVVLLAGREQRTVAYFEHRYGDDILTLVEKAITALHHAGAEQFARWARCAGCGYVIRPGLAYVRQQDSSDGEKREWHPNCWALEVATRESRLELDSVTFGEHYDGEAVGDE